jgi:hypothetical protein
MSRVELESSLEERCVRRVETLGGVALKLQMPGVRGFPDRTVLIEGRVFFVEFKRSKGGVVSTQQRRWHERLRRLGFYCATVDSEEDFDSLFEERLNA